MEQIHEKTLDANLPKLCKELQLKPILMGLQSCDIVSQYQANEIKSEKTPLDRNYAFITLLKTCGPKAFEEFLNQLYEWQPHLADCLTKEPKKSNQHSSENSCLLVIFRVGWRLIKQRATRVLRTRAAKDHHAP
uniref:CARD domain-containing protein n=1 Tax=Plectus sambesii TaxID=2011161 RepID=A0A914X264_9BILA